MKRALLLSAALSLTTAASSAQAQPSALRIPFERHQLDNGLTVLLHEDHSQPLLVVNLNVDVGSRDEPAGRTGFAHLFEHLMFMGTTRVPEKMFDAWMEAEGAWNNAWTNNDRTDYYDVGPSHTLPLLLWMEADRFANLGGEIDQAKLDTQRDVVRNERRQQVENTPYGVADLRLPELLYPAGHPYHHPVIGSHADLEAAKVEDVRAFFAEHYVASNVAVVIAGDFEPADVLPLVKKYLGTIAASKERAPRRKPAAAPVLKGVVREALEDDVTLAKLIVAYHSPAVYAPGDAELDLLSAVMTQGKVSRLYKALVYDQKVAQSVTAYQASMGLGSHFNIEVLASPNVPLDVVEKALDVEIDKLRQEAISEAELARAKNQYEANFVRRMQSLATRAALLNTYLALRGEPDYVARDLERYTNATSAGVLAVTQRVLDPQRRVILHVVPKSKEAKP
jgi:predicted Zn-dependent peptidase